MNKLIITAVLTFCILSSLFAQSDYYYYKGKKEPLIKSFNKMVSISSISEDMVSCASKGLSLVKTFSDKNTILNVYEVSDIIVSAKDSGSVNLQYCYTDIEGEMLIPNGYINVKLQSESDYSILQGIAEENHCVIVEQNTFMPLWYNLKIARGSERNSVEVANIIYETGYFAESCPSFTVDALEISYDPEVLRQWGLYNSKNEGFDISVCAAWNYATGRGIKIAIIDTGIDMNHPDLISNIYPLSYDTEMGVLHSECYDDHGTHCAGIVAAIRNNGKFISGVAPDAKLISVSNRLELNSEWKLANGINWAWQIGADIISCSWRCTKNSLIDSAINNAVTLGREGKGCVFVKSAGNSWGSITYPGDYGPEVLAVASMNSAGGLAPSSAHGSNLFVSAPGVDILSTVPENSIAINSGTSMACPHVSGLAALILERNPQLTAEQVRKIIAKNAKKIGNIPYDTMKIYGTWNEFYGYGLIDAYEAVRNTPRN